MDEDGHDQGLASGDDNSSKMLTETIRMFFKMLEKSEGRIDRTNMMIEKLVDACKAVELAYTSHVGSLQVSRDTSQKSNARLIAANERMTRMMETARVDSAKERERYVQHIANLEYQVPEGRAAQGHGQILGTDGLIPEAGRGHEQETLRP